MIRFLLGFVALIAVTLPGWSQETEPPTERGAHNKTGESAGAGAVQERLASYLEAFNSGKAESVAAFWTADGVSVAEETGERTAGREALQREFAAFFEANPGTRLSGEVATVRTIQPNVVVADGTTTLFVPDAEPVQSAFTAILVKEGDQWQISSSHERDLPAPPTPYDALKELEWMVGRWQDQTDDALVETTVRWSPNQAFLIRSFSAEFEDGGGLHGTQVIGWDPVGKQIRTWTFNSDGSFGQGTVSRNDGEWVVKMTQTLADGRIAAGTKILTPADDGSMTVQTVGETVDGEPLPVSEPVTVVRIAEPSPAEETLPTGEPVPAVEENATQGGGANQ